MDIKEQSKDVRKYYANKNNFMNFIYFTIVIGFLCYFMIECIKRASVTGNMYWWSTLGFTNDFFIGFLAGYLLITSILGIYIYTGNKQKWKSVFLINNINDMGKIIEIGNELLKTNTKLTTSLMNTEVKKYPEYIKRAIRGHHWILVVNDGRVISKDNKKYIDYAYKTQKIIKWYGKSDFKFERQKALFSEKYIGWYLSFIISMLGVLGLSHLLTYIGVMDTYNPTSIQLIIIYVTIIVIPVLIHKKVRNWCRMRLKKIDRRYKNVKELKRMEDE